MNRNSLNQGLEGEMLYPATSPTRPNTKCRDLILLLIYIIAVGVIFGIFTFYPPAKKALIDFFHTLVSEGFIGYLLIVLISTVLMCTPFPFSYLEIFYGFIFNYYYVAFLVDTVVIIFGTLICYTLGKSLFKNSALAYFKEKKYFRVLKKMVSCNNLEALKNVFLIRLIYIPLFIKNYGIPAFDVKFWIYIIASIPQSLALGAWRIFVGAQTRAISDNFDDVSKSESSLGVLIGTILLSIIIVIYLYCFSKKELSNLEEEEKILFEKERGETKNLELNSTPLKQD